MAKLSIAMSLVIMLGIVPHYFSGDVAAQSAVLKSEEQPSRVDFRGTFASQPILPSCAITTTSQAPVESELRAIHIDQSGNAMTMRIVPTGSVRVLYIQSRRHAAPEPLPAMWNGLARWDGDSLVVSTQLPALPLWTHRHSPQLEGAMLERFSVTDGIHFTYRAWYEPTGEFSEAAPFEVTLTKCAGVLLDESDRP
jgi:hypothetical protein